MLLPRELSLLLSLALALALPLPVTPQTPPSNAPTVVSMPDAAMPDAVRQTIAPSAASPNLPQPPVVAAPCPASFYAAGASFNPQATPNLAGWYAIALPITKCEKAFQAYSITLSNLTPKGSGANLTFTSTTSTGLAIPLKQIGPIDIFTFGTLGTSISGSSSSLAGTWGGIAVVPIGKTIWRLTPWAQSIGGKWTGGLGIGRSY